MELLYRFDYFPLFVSILWPRLGCVYEMWQGSYMNNNAWILSIVHRFHFLYNFWLKIAVGYLEKKSLLSWGIFLREATAENTPQVLWRTPFVRARCCLWRRGDWLSESLWPGAVGPRACIPSSEGLIIDQCDGVKMYLGWGLGLQVVPWRFESLF